MSRAQEGGEVSTRLQRTGVVRPGVEEIVYCSKQLLEPVYQLHVMRCRQMLLSDRQQAQQELVPLREKKICICCQFFLKKKYSVIVPIKSWLEIEAVGSREVRWQLQECRIGRFDKNIRRLHNISELSKFLTHNGVPFALLTDTTQRWSQTDQWNSGHTGTETFLDPSSLKETVT